MKKFLIASASLVVLGFGGSAAAATFPAIGADTGPGVIITLNANGTVTLATTGQGPYDSIEDTYVGVVNNTSSSVASIHVSSTSSADGGIFAFDGDGIGVSPFNAGANALDTSSGKYGGPSAYFTNIVTVNVPFSQSGNVNFIGGIAPNGGLGYFSLEGPVTASDFQNVVVGGIVPEPTSWAMMLVGFFGLGSLLRRQRRDVLA